MKKTLVLSVVIAMFAILSCAGSGVRADDSNENGASFEEKRDPGEPLRGKARGVAAIFDNDTALARDRAINDARNKLVEDLLGTTVSGRSIAENFQLVSMLIEARSYGLVKNEKILEEGSDGTLYSVELEGTVEPAVVEDAIADALNRYGRPKFMILIKETFDGTMNQPGMTETEILMQERMSSAGFDFVDVQIVQDLMKRQYGRMSRAMNGQISEDVQNLLLNDAGAEVLIIGTAQTKDQSGTLRGLTRNMKSKSAILRLKAVDVYSGRILAATSKDAPGAHIQSDTASKKAIENVTRMILGGKDESTGKVKTGPFMDEIVKQFVKSATHRQITLFITGLDYDGLKKFRNQVGYRIRGVQQVLDRGRSGKAARLEILFAGTTNEFIDELKAKAERLGFSIEIPENFPNRVTINAGLLGGG